MTIQLIDNKGLPFLLKIGDHTYHFWSWRTLTIAGKATYHATTKGSTLGWYTPDGWVSYNQLKAAMKKQIG